MADAFEPRFVDLVRNFTTTQGTGDFALGGAVSGFTSFASALAVGDRFYYCAAGVDKPNEREVGRGTYVAGGRIAREPLGGLPFDFSSGTKTVALVVPAEWFANAHGAISGVAMVDAAGDGVSDDSAAMVAAFESGRKVVFGKPPGGKYRFAAGAIVELTQALDVDFGGHEIEFAGGVLTFTAPRVASGRKLAANAARYATSVTLDSAAGIEPGDLLHINTGVAAETGWGYTKKDVVKVRSVGGNLVELEEPIMFAYATGNAGLTVDAYRPQRIRLVRPFASTTGPSIMINFEFLENVEIISPKIVGSRSFDSANDTSRIGFRFHGCWGVSVRDAQCDFMSYPLMPSRGTRNTLIDGLTASGCRHPVSPSDWPKGVVVRNMRASDCHAAIDSHPAFDVTYEEARTARDRDLSNLRCVGGALRNCRIHTLADDSALGPYFHNLTPGADVAGYLYSDADFRVDQVELLAPNRTLPSLKVERGRTVFVDGLAAPAGAAAFSTGAINAIGLVMWGPNNRLGPRTSPERSTANGVRCPIRVMQPPLLAAYLEGGVYHVDPRLQMVDQLNNRLFCQGPVARLLSGAPSVTVPIRIHTNAFGNIDSVTYVQGRLKLRAKARHNSGGVFASLEKEFNFFHSAVATSGVYFPTNAAATSAATGQTYESNLTLAIANPSQAGATELGTGGDFTVGIDATVAMAGVSSPVFDLEYELRIEAMQ